MTAAPADADLPFPTQRDGDRITITVDADLDTVTAPLLLETAAAVGAGSSELVVDLRQVHFVAAAGLNALVAMHTAQRRRGARLTVVGTSRYVTRLFRIAELGWLLGLADDNPLARELERLRLQERHRRRASAPAQAGVRSAELIMRRADRDARRED